MPSLQPTPRDSHILSGWPWGPGGRVEGSKAPGPPNVPHPDAPIRGSARQEILRRRGIIDESPCHTLEAPATMGLKQEPCHTRNKIRAFFLSGKIMLILLGFFCAQKSSIFI